MSTQHEQIVAAYEQYIAENEKFTQKGVKASAARARKALQEMSKGIKERRKEITAEKEALSVVELEKLKADLEVEMHKAAEDLDFEKAISLRNQWLKLHK